MHNKEINQISFRQEFFRKLTHLGALIIPGGYYYFDLSKNSALAIMIPVALGMIVVDVARLRGWKLWNFFRPMIAPIIRDHEIKGDFTGATYILLTSCLVIGLFDKPVAMAALAFIMAGDVAAALIGRKFGRLKFKNKSLEGSLSFLGASIIVAFAVASLDPGLPIKIGLSGALVATITEAVSFTIDDNATVPLVSGLTMHFLFFVF